MRKDRQKDKVERGCKEKAAYESVERQVEAEQQMKERSAKKRYPDRKDCRKSQKTSYEDQVSTNTNEEERIVHNGQEMTLEEMGRQPLPDVVQELYEEYLRTRAVEASTEEK